MTCEAGPDRPGTGTPCLSRAWRSASIRRPPPARPPRGGPAGPRVGAYYPAEKVTVTGELREYARATDAGHTFTSRFCPRCGTSVLWASGKNPGRVGVAVGAIADPRFPAPDRSVWEESRHGWVDLAPAREHFPRGRET